MYGNDSGMNNNNSNTDSNTDIRGTYNQDIDNNMTSNGSVGYPSENTTYNTYTETKTETKTEVPVKQEYNETNYDEDVSFGGFEDDRTGTKKSFNKWVILIPIIILFLILLIIFILISSANRYIVKTKNIDIVIGESETIKVTAKDKVKKKLTYVSENNKVASVDKKGNVTGVGMGTTNVWVGLNGKKTKKISVHIDTNKKELVFKENNITVAKDSTYKLEITNVLADDVFTWESKNNNVATVDENGLVTGIHGGSTTIVVTESDGRRSSVKVNVTSDEILVENIALTEQTIGIGETRQLQPTIAPNNALKILSWESSKETIAVVDENGKVTGLAEGTTTITVTTHNGKTAKAKIIVDSKVASSIKINGCVKKLSVGDNVTLTAIVSPSTASQSVTWSSSNSNILSVSGGKVTARGKGSAVITATTKSGKTATCKISVGSMAVNSLRMNTVQLTINQGSTKVLSVSFNPSSAKDYYTIKWTSSNNRVATVDENGVVTGVGAGNATITASAGGKKATAAVTVKGSGTTENITSVKISNCPTSLLVNQKYTLRATTTPANGKVTWYTSNSNVSTVSNGTLTPKKTGTVRISAVAGGKEAICQIIITDGISLNGCPTGYLNIGKTFTLYADVQSGAIPTWSSSNTNIATVSNGKVTTKAAGTAKITASASGKSTTCTIDVRPSITKINAISAVTMGTLESNKLRTINFTTNLTSEQMRKYYKNTELTFTYSKTGIVEAHAIYSDKFTLTGKKAGSTTVYVKIGGQSYGFKVTVK